MVHVHPPDLRYPVSMAPPPFLPLPISNFFLLASSRLAASVEGSKKWLIIRMSRSQGEMTGCWRGGKGCGGRMKEGRSGGKGVETNGAKPCCCVSTLPFLPFLLLCPSPSLPSPRPHHLGPLSRLAPLAYCFPIAVATCTPLTPRNAFVSHHSFIRPALPLLFSIRSPYLKAPVRPGCPTIALRRGGRKGTLGGREGEGG